MRCPGMLMPPGGLALGQEPGSAAALSAALAGPAGGGGGDGTPYLEDRQGLILANVLEVDLLLLLPADSQGRIACKRGVGRGTTP